MNLYFASPILLNILVGGLVFVVLIVAVVKSITGRKHKTDENKKRRREVAKKIKEYVKVQYNYTNVSIGFKKIVQRTGAAYRNREIYDVIVSLLNLKINKLVCLKAFEVEAVKKQVAPKMFNFIWRVNGELDYNKSYKNALINEGKLKLSRHQSKEEKIKYKKKFKIYQQKQRRLQKQQRQVIQHFIPERFLPEQK